MSRMKSWLDMKLEEAKIAAAQQQNERENDDSKFVTVPENGNAPNSLIYRIFSDFQRKIHPYISIS